MMCCGRMISPICSPSRWRIEADFGSSKVGRGRRHAGLSLVARIAAAHVRSVARADRGLCHRAVARHAGRDGHAAVPRIAVRTRTRQRHNDGDFYLHAHRYQDRPARGAGDTAGRAWSIISMPSPRRSPAVRCGYSRSRRNRSLPISRRSRTGSSHSRPGRRTKSDRSTCPSGAFADSRFSINCWARSKKPAAPAQSQS